MHSIDLFWPAVVLFLWTQLVVLRLATLRFRAVREQRVDPRYYKAFRGDGEPADVAVVSRHLVNLYEAPTLFYAGVAIAIAIDVERSRELLIALAWVYVALRMLHSLIHLTLNKVIWRFRVFAASWIVLLFFWIVLTGQVVSGAAIATS
ncbi:MAG: MAPEG family protein [Sphingomonadaceae bacterium]